MGTPDDPIRDFWVSFLQAMAIQPYRKADEPEQLRCQLDLFFMPLGPKDWKNPLAIKNFTSQQEWPKPTAGTLFQRVIQPASRGPNFGKQDLRHFLISFDFSRSIHLIIVMGGYNECVTLHTWGEASKHTVRQGKTSQSIHICSGKFKKWFLNTKTL